MQTLIFIGSSRDDIRAFPEAARREVWIAVNGQFRVFYVTNIGNAVYVLHAFQKKTQKTSPKDLALGQQRFTQIGE